MHSGGPRQICYSSLICMYTEYVVIVEPSRAAVAVKRTVLPYPRSALLINIVCRLEWQKLKEPLLLSSSLNSSSNAVFLTFLLRNTPRCCFVYKSTATAKNATDISHFRSTPSRTKDFHVMTVSNRKFHLIDSPSTYGVR